MRLIVLGRNPQDVDVVIMGDYVSNYHAEIIQLDNGDMYIVDKSTNGTYVDGLRLVPGKETAITRNATVYLADQKLDWGQILPLPPMPAGVVGVKSIGSHYLNDITVQGTSVSRFHATMRHWKDGKWEICDHSKNGTTINGRRITKGAWVRIKRGDEIAAAGVPLQNPVGGAGFWKTAGIIVAALALTAGIILGILAATTNSVKTDPKLLAMYDRSVVLVYTTYHYEVECGDLDISQLPDPDSYVKGRATASLYDKFVVTAHDTIERYDGSNSEGSLGTGFFVGKQYDIVTARHCARPWEFSTMNYSSVSRQAAAESYYKAKLNKLVMMGYGGINPYISQVKVKGIVDDCMVFPNHTYVDEKNAYNCHEIACSQSLDEDVAILRLRAQSLPMDITSVPVNRITKTAPKNASHVFTIGFPFGLALQNIEKTELQASNASGSVSSIKPPYSFGLSAVSYHGASGSPVFNNKGMLVGMLNAGIDSSQGFNFAIQPQYIRSLLDQIQ